MSASACPRWRSFRAGWLLVALAFAGAVGRGAAQPLVVAPDRADGIYGVGATVRWRVTCPGTEQAPAARYRLLRGQRTEVGQGGLAFRDGEAVLETRHDAPGSLLLEVTWTQSDGSPGRAVGGVVVAPEKTALSAPPPDDFDAFWAVKVAELAEVPPQPEIERVEIGNPALVYEKVTLANIRGTRIHGQLARPATGAQFPALLIVQWANVYPLQRRWVTDRAAEGWLVFNIQAHDLPVDGPEQDYKDLQATGPLHDYWRIGNDDRERSYYLRMYLSCYRAADYLAGRPEWDGRTLVVMGGSQGGMQALVTAGLHPKISAALASVPAGCDMLGPEVGRKGGWPQWYDNIEGRDPARVRAAGRYFDVANFARRIRCPVLIGVGLRDEVCPAEGIFAAANRIIAPKEIVVLPRGAHQDEQGTHAAYDERCYGAWLPALRATGASPALKAQVSATPAP